MVDFDKLSHISHTTSMVSVLDHYSIGYENAASDRYKIICPFHDDTDPSLIIYHKDDHVEESYFCFVCNEGGDPFCFIRAVEDDFKQAWSVLCHINGISDAEAVNLDSLTDLLRPTRNVEEDRSKSSINSQISAMYRNYFKKSFEVIMDPVLRSELTQAIDNRFKALDKCLKDNPSYAEIHQFYKNELSLFKEMKKYFK